MIMLLVHVASHTPFCMVTFRNLCVCFFCALSSGKHVVSFDTIATVYTTTTSTHTQTVVSWKSNSVNATYSEWGLIVRIIGLAVGHIGIRVLCVSICNNQHWKCIDSSFYSDRYTHTHQTKFPDKFRYNFSLGFRYSSKLTWRIAACLFVQRALYVVLVVQFK